MNSCNSYLLHKTNLSDTDIAAFTQLHSFESNSSKSIANNCSIFFMFPEGKKRLERMMDCMTYECAIDLIESINEVIKAHNIKYK